MFNNNTTKNNTNYVPDGKKLFRARCKNNVFQQTELPNHSVTFVTPTDSVQH